MWNPKTDLEKMLFRRLDSVEEAQFRAYAQKTDPPPSDNWLSFHPICREEWIKRGLKENA